MLRLLFIFISLVSVSACDVLDPGVLYVDPAIDLSGYDGGFVVEGDPHLEMGFYIEQLYKPLGDGEPCYVAWGLQGGTWTMPALRTKGIGTPATVSCTMVTETGEVVSEVVSKSQLYLTPDRYLEIQAYPIPVHHPAPNEQEPIDDLYGLMATLECEVMDEEGRAKSVVYEVEIVEG